MAPVRRGASESSEKVRSQSHTKGRRMKRLVTKRMLVVLPVLAAAFAVAAAAQASTIGQREALGAAKSYLSSGHFSRAGLIDQLESPYGEDFSHSDAVWGVNHAHANWYAEAVKAAKSYLHSGHF